MLEHFEQKDYYQVPKLWGSETWLTNRECGVGIRPGYCAKLLRLNDGWQCSLHKHQDKDEQFFVLEGEVELHVVAGTLPGRYRQTMVLSPGDNYHISPGVYHRFNTAKPGGALILEVSSPHNDRDVERAEESKQHEPSSPAA